MLKARATPDRPVDVPPPSGILVPRAESGRSMILPPAVVFFMAPTGCQYQCCCWCLLLRSVCSATKSACPCTILYVHARFAQVAKVKLLNGLLSPCRTLHQLFSALPITLPRPSKMLEYAQKCLFGPHVHRNMGFHSLLRPCAIIFHLAKKFAQPAKTKPASLRSLSGIN